MSTDNLKYIERGIAGLLPGQKPKFGLCRINPDHPLSKYIVGCWLMNEGGGDTVYDLVKNKTGTFSGTVNRGVGIVGGYVGDTPAANGHNIPIDAGVLSGATEYTVLIHVSTNSKAQNPGADLYSQGVNTINQLLLITIQSGSLIDSWWGNDASTTYTPNDGVPSVIASTYDKVSKKLFIDGVLKVTTAKTTFNVSTANAAIIGKRGANTGGKSCNAKVFFTYIYDKALSDKQIQFLSADPYQILEPNFSLTLYQQTALANLTIDIIERIAVEEYNLLNDLLLALTINVYEQAASIDGLTSGDLPLPGISKFDNIAIQELLEMLIAFLPNRFENVAIQELVTTLMSNLESSVFDNTVIQDVVEMLITGGGPNRFDNSVIQEFITTLMSNLESSTQDLTVIQESVSTLMSNLENSSVDNSVIQEFITTLMSNLEIDSSDNIAIQENISALMSNLEKSVLERTAIQEYIELTVAESGLNINERTAIQEVITLLFSDLQFSVSDSSVILENITTVMSNLENSINENTAVQEYVSTVVSGGNTSKFDNIGINENIALLMNILNNSSDNIAVQEYVNAVLSGITLEITPTSMAAIVENVVMAMDVNLSQYDLSGIVEYVMITFDKVLQSAYDNISIKEYINVVTSGAVIYALKNFTALNKKFAFSAKKTYFNFNS